jgi:hypothetical protein
LKSPGGIDSSLPGSMAGDMFIGRFFNDNSLGTGINSIASKDKFY